MPKLDPQIAALTAAMEAAKLPHLTSLSVAQARSFATKRSAQAPAGPDLPLVRDLQLAGPTGPIAARFYMPRDHPAGLITYFHGGGWVVGDLETHDAIVRNLAAASGCAFVAVDYRLAPEHPFPAPVEDAWAALLEVDRLGDELVRPGTPRAVAGDSAGGTLAAVCAILARDSGAPKLAAQMLLYPATSGRMEHPSIIDGDNAPVLDSRAMRWFWDHYASEQARSDWRASPLNHPNLTGVAPALVVTAGFDPLRDEGEDYAERLRAAGVPVTLQSEASLVHGFAGMTFLVEAAATAMNKAAQTLRTLCTRATDGRSRS